jgi:hypothetical protein
MISRLSPWKTIEADYLAWLCIVSPLVLWSFYLFLVIAKIGGINGGSLWLPALVLTVLGGVGFYLRYQALAAHFRRGVTVPGKIVRTMHLQDLGRVIYKYTYLTKEFQTTNYIHYATRSMRVDKMENISVVLDPANPRSALIRDLFFPETYMGIETTDDEEEV